MGAVDKAQSRLRLISLGTSRGEGSTAFAAEHHHSSAMDYQPSMTIQQATANVCFTGADILGQSNNTIRSNSGERIASNSKAAETLQKYAQTQIKLAEARQEMVIVLLGARMLYIFLLVVCLGDQVCRTLCHLHGRIRANQCMNYQCKLLLSILFRLEGSKEGTTGTTRVGCK